MWPRKAHVDSVGVATEGKGKLGNVRDSGVKEREEKVTG